MISLATLLWSIFWNHCFQYIYSFNTTRACGTVCSEHSGFGLIHSTEQKTVSNATDFSWAGCSGGCWESAKQF